MGTGPGPKGTVVGLMKCTHKTPHMGGKTSVSFVAEDPEVTGAAIFNMPHEDAEYFTVDTVYSFSATTP